MADPIHDLTRALPGLDCGLCSRPTCRSFAYGLAASKTRIGDCPFTFREGVEERVRSALVHVREAEEGPPPPPGGGVVIFQPCLDEPGRVMVGFSLINSSPPPAFEVLDVVSASWLLQGSGLFTAVRSSPGLGVVRALLGERVVVASRDGRVNIRRALDRPDAERAVDVMRRTLSGGLICPHCSTPLIDCVGGGCETCREGRAISKGSGDLDDEILAYLSGGVEFLLEGGRSLRENGTRLEDGWGLIEKAWRKAFLGLVNPDASSGSREHLRVIAVISNLTRISQALGALKAAPWKVDEEGWSSLGESLNILQTGYSFLVGRGEEALEHPAHLYKVLKAEWVEAILGGADPNPNPIRIASNSYFLSLGWEKRCVISLALP